MPMSSLSGRTRPWGLPCLARPSPSRPSSACGEPPRRSTPADHVSSASSATISASRAPSRRRRRLSLRRAGDAKSENIPSAAGGTRPMSSPTPSLMCRFAPPRSSPGRWGLQASPSEEAGLSCGVEHGLFSRLHRRRPVDLGSSPGLRDGQIDARDAYGAGGEAAGRQVRRAQTPFVVWAPVSPVLTLLPEQHVSRVVRPLVLPQSPDRVEHRDRGHRRSVTANGLRPHRGRRYR